MNRYIYSRWDGLQERYSLDADEVLDELSRFMMEGLEAGEALDWMRQGGFELAGLNFRVMGIEELISELRERAREMLSPFNMRHSFDERWRRLRELLQREERAVGEREGLESVRWSDFKARESELPSRLSEALERFEGYRWSDPEAERAYRELLESLDETRRLEEFAGRNRRHLQGPESLDFDSARELMEELEALSEQLQNLLSGNLGEISLDALREQLGDEAAQSLVMLRDLRGSLERAGYLRGGEDGVELTPRAVRKVGQLALEDIYSSLSRSARGGHETEHFGGGQISTERTRPYEFGRPAQLDAVGTLRNALRRRARTGASGGSAGRVPLTPEDLEIFDSDLATEATTVLLLDMSWSMSWSERWPAAKRVAVAMDHLIRTHYPRDRFFIVGFYTRARELHIRELPELAWNMNDPFTNLQDGLRVAQRLIDRNPSPNSQVIVITDGQPTAYFEGEELHVEWPSGRGGISPTAVRETLREVRRVTRKDITINTFMLDDSPQLLGFVEAMTQINKGRAFYTTPSQIGQYVMVDYLTQRRRRIR